MYIILILAAIMIGASTWYRQRKIKRIQERSWYIIIRQKDIVYAWMGLIVVFCLCIFGIYHFMVVYNVCKDLIVNFEQFNEYHMFSNKHLNQYMRMLEGFDHYRLSRYKDFLNLHLPFVIILLIKEIITFKLHEGVAFTEDGVEYDGYKLLWEEILEYRIGEERNRLYKLKKQPFQELYIKHSEDSVYIQIPSKDQQMLGKLRAYLHERVDPMMLRRQEENDEY